MNLVLHRVAGNEHLGRGCAEHIVDAVSLVLKKKKKLRSKARCGGWGKDVVDEEKKEIFNIENN